MQPCERLVDKMTHVQAPAQKMNVAEVGERLSLMKVLAIPAVRFAALLQIWGWTVDNSIAGASTTFFYTSVELGGWGWTSQRISMLLAFTGITAAIWSALMLPPVTRRYGERLIIIVAAYIMLLIPLWYIISNELLRHRLDVAFWAILPIIATVSTLALSSCLGQSSQFTLLSGLGLTEHFQYCSQYASCSEQSCSALRPRAGHEHHIRSWGLAAIRLTNSLEHSAGDQRPQPDLGRSFGMDRVSCMVCGLRRICFTKRLESRPTTTK